MYLYECSPIDWWVGWSTYEDILQQIRAEDEYMGSMTNGVRESDHLRFLEATGRALTGFRALGWEGDGDIKVTALPSPEPYVNGAGIEALVLAVKQGNNGTTYLASQVPMPWLGNTVGRKALV